MYEDTQNTKITATKTVEEKIGFDQDLIDLLKESGQEYFDELVKFLYEKTDAKYVLVGEYLAKTNSVSTLAFDANNHYVKSYEYDLENTPCSLVIGDKICIYPKNVQQLFPKDKDLKEYEIESYAGLPLFDLSNNPVGIVVVMDDKPFDRPEQIKDVFELIESKAELELERIFLQKQNVLSHKEFIQTFQNFQDVFFTTHYNNNREQVDFVISPSVEKTLGYTLEDIKELNFIDFYAVPEDRKLFFKLLKVEKQVKNHPLTFKKKDGTTIFVEVDCELITEKLPDDIAFSLRGILRDVTEKYKENLRTEIAYLIAQKSQRRLTNIKLLAEFIHKTLGRVMNVSNFYVALHDADKNELYMPVFIDEYKKISEGEFRAPYANGLTEYIIKSKSVLVKDKKELQELIDKEGLSLRGKLSEYYVGVPLKSEGLCFGIMVMQSYKAEYHFNKEDIELLKFISTQFAYVIERTQWQKSIIKKEEHYRSLVENSSEIIGIINEEGIIHYISESSEKIIGYSPAELMGENVSKFIKIDNLSQLLKDRINRPLEKTTEILKAYDNEGNKKYLEISLNKNKNKNKSNELIFNAKDITDRVHANRKRELIQLKLKERQDDLTDIFNYTTEGIAKTSDTGKFLFVNKRLCEMLGYTEKELLKKDFQDITYEHDMKRSVKLFNKIRKEKITDFSFDKKYVHKKGNLIDCHVTVKWTFDTEDKVDYSIAFISDKTEERKAQKQVVDLRYAIDNALAVFFSDSKGQIRDINKRLEILSGYSRKEIIGNTPKIFNSDYHSKKEWKLFWETIKSGKTYKGEMRNRKKDGSIYWVYVTVSPVINESGIIDQYIAIQNDITAEKKVKNNIVRTVIEAQEHERERFAMEIHDGLGQVLLAAKMNLSAVQDAGEGLNAESKDVLNNSIDLLTEAIQEARNISHGLMSRVLNHFGLAYAVNEIINNINTTSSLNFTIKHNIKDVRFEEEIEMGLYRTLQELIKNIIKHSKATKAYLSITKLGNKLFIEIRDNGIGMEKGTINNTRSSGIGLRNMRSRIQYLGGVFKIDNKIKKGTKIKISISL